MVFHHARNRTGKRHRDQGRGMNDRNGKFDPGSPLCRRAWEACERACWGAGGPAPWLTVASRDEFTALVLKAARSGRRGVLPAPRRRDRVLQVPGRTFGRNKFWFCSAYEELWRCYWTVTPRWRNSAMKSTGTEGDGAIDDRTIRDILKRLTLPVSADKTGRPRKVRKTRK